MNFLRFYTYFYNENYFPDLFWDFKVPWTAATILYKLG